MNLKFGVELEFFGTTPAKIVEKFFSNGKSVWDLASTDERPVRRHERTREWKLVKDTSVANEGLELVSPVLYGKNGLKELQTVCTWLKELECKVDRSCGLHVHVDAENYSVEQIVAILNCWSQHESNIDEIVAPHRRKGNRFCNSVTPEMIEEYKKALLQPRVSNLTIAKLFDRYFKINIQSLLRHGTVEFRLHEGTIDYETCANWVKFCVNFVEKTTQLVKVTENPLPTILARRLLIAKIFHRMFEQLDKMPWVMSNHHLQYIKIFSIEELEHELKGHNWIISCDFLKIFHNLFQINCSWNVVAKELIVYSPIQNALFCDLFTMENINKIIDYFKIIPACKIDFTNLPEEDLVPVELKEFFAAKKEKMKEKEFLQRKNIAISLPAFVNLTLDSEGSSEEENEVRS